MCLKPSIRLLSQKMSMPTEGDMRTLKHLVSYLTQTTRRMLVFDEPKRGVGFAGVSPSGELLLEAFTNSDWSGCKTTRRSVSAAAILLDGNFLSSSSRTQKSISLSTAEAEYNAATSTTVDALFLRNVLKFLMPDQPLHLRLLCDSAAARCEIRSRKGEAFGRQDALWLQSKCKETNIERSAIATRFNIADLFTKPLARTRSDALLNFSGMRDEEGAPIGASNVAEMEEQLHLRSTVRRIQQELRDQHGLVGSRGMTLAKRILQLGTVSNLMGCSTGENSLDEALSLEESPIFMSENQFWIIFDIVMFSGFVIFLLCVCYTFCMYARGYRLYKRSVCEDRSTQTVDVRVASSLRFEEELTVERSSAAATYLQTGLLFG